MRCALAVLTGADRRCKGCNTPTQALSGLFRRAQQAHRFFFAREEELDRIQIQIQRWTYGQWTALWCVYRQQCQCKNTRRTVCCCVVVAPKGCFLHCVRCLLSVWDFPGFFERQILAVHTVQYNREKRVQIEAGSRRRRERRSCYRTYS